MINKTLRSNESMYALVFLFSCSEYVDLDKTLVPSTKEIRGNMYNKAKEILRDKEEIEE